MAGKWYQVLDAVFEASGDVWINKNPCGGRGFGVLSLQKDLQAAV
jgi:hypothetical protein